MNNQAVAGSWQNSGFRLQNGHNGRLQTPEGIQGGGGRRGIQGKCSNRR